MSFLTAARRLRNLIVPLIILVSVASALADNKTPPAKPIDINVANVKELEELPGVGAVTAQRIIDMRQKSGRFKRVEDLLAVRGISAKKLEAMRPYVRVAPPPAPPPQKAATPPAKTPAPSPQKAPAPPAQKSSSSQ